MKCKAWVGLQCLIVVHTDHTHLLFAFNYIALHLNSISIYQIISKLVEITSLGFCHYVCNIVISVITYIH